MNNIKRIERYIAKVEQFNRDLMTYYNESGDNELPEIESTIIGCSGLDAAVITRTDNGFTCDLDGWEYKVEIVTDEEGEEYITGWEDGYDALKDTIAYERRRLNKAWRVWRSANPDAELEKDDDNE